MTHHEPAIDELAGDPRAGSRQWKTGRPRCSFELVLPVSRLSEGARSGDFRAGQSRRRLPALATTAKGGGAPRRRSLGGLLRADRDAVAAPSCPKLSGTTLRDVRCG
jgi:hypothetical protein